MGKVLAGHYRYVTEKNGEPVRVLLAPGDDLPKGFSSKEAKQLEKDGLLVDEKRLTEDGLRIPHGSPDREVKVTETSGNAAGGAGDQGNNQGSNQSGDQGGNQGDNDPKTAKTTGSK